jgi:hypothetical protein
VYQEIAPAHPLPERGDLLLRRRRDQRERRVARVEVGQVADLVSEHRTAATRILYRHRACGDITHVEPHRAVCGEVLHSTDVDIEPGAGLGAAEA